MHSIQTLARLDDNSSCRALVDPLVTVCGVVEVFTVPEDALPGMSPEVVPGIACTEADPYIHSLSLSST